MSAQLIQCANELATCGGYIAGTVFFIFLVKAIFQRNA